MINILCSPIDELEMLKLKEAGCNMVLLSDEFHGTRMPAFFSMNKLDMMIDNAKKWDLKVVIAMNRIYMEEDLNSIDPYLEYLVKKDVDYIYYNDPCIYIHALKYDITDRLIYNPDTLCSNSFDINFMLHKGIYGCVIAKELTLQQMCEIAGKTNNSMVIIHGYLNMSYSKRLLLDSYLDMINKDIDLKHNYHLKLKEATRNDYMPVYEDDKCTCIYTPYVQESFEELNILIDSGVNNFIIERSFVDIDMICDAIRAYRDIESGKDAKLIKEAFYQKYDNYPLSSGYMYQKTTLVKV